LANTLHYFAHQFALYDSNSLFNYIRNKATNSIGLRIRYLIILAWIVFFPVCILRAQTVFTSTEDSLFRVNGEVYFRFHLSDRSRLDSLTRIISIDNFKDGEVFAYANRAEFSRFRDLQLVYTLLPPPGSLLNDQELNMGNIKKTDQNMTVWNFYPTYSQYVSLMTGFATSFPSICHLDTIGTTNTGRLLLAVKISDSVNYDRGVPQVLLTSSIHGDELTGYVLMLHLIDTLLNSYGSSTRITNLIRNTQIYINPLANPDGTYKGGNNTVGGATRGNQNGIDMNRNYWDPAAGQHPDGNAWQRETIAFMEYAGRKRFSMSMNFHGGSEVVNYPWDTWTRLTADDAWWQFVSHEYADTAKKYGPSGYFTNVTPNGITNGYAWYTITGGRQDYHNYFRHDREVTLEISVTKNPAASTLLNFWKYNKNCFLNYIEEARYGINGKVYDSVTYAPVAAKVLISTHDMDSSFVYSTLPSGWYFRMINTGSWNLTFSAPGYYSRTITGISAALRTTNVQNVKLRPIDIYWPRSFLAIPVSSSEIDLSWGKNGSGDPVMIAASTTNTFGTPVNGTTYTARSTLAGGGTIIYNGPNTAFPHTQLDPSTTWYYRAWSVKAGNNYSTSAAASATTLLCGSCGTFPLTENFNTASSQLPNCWTQEATGTNAENVWTRVNFATAGGTAWEMRLPRQSTVTTGTNMLKTYMFNTKGVSVLTLSFKHLLSARNPGAGATLKVQSSSDGVTWTDEWSVLTGNNNIGPATVNVNITHNLNSPTTVIAFVATGNLSRFNNWDIDDVSLKAPGFWVGGTLATPTDWNTTTNWGDGVVPTAATNVYIPPRIYLPVVTNDPLTPAQCKDLVISRDAIISVSSGKKLVVNGKFTLQAP
jgi:hypothetical protein